MNLRKSLNFFLFFFFFFFLSNRRVFARENSFLTIVNPVRGNEFFQQKTPGPAGVEYQRDLLNKAGLKATWLLRSDVFDSLIFFDKDFTGHELGIFLEILPSLAKNAGVNYPPGGIFWHDANKIFLSGYKLEDRIKLIDKTLFEFKNAFGYYPRSVGAWHIDAFSAEYMRRKYGLTGVLICADQFGTDGYQIWGGWWGVPYYPSKYNILTPAQTLKNKLDLVIFWWAARDPKLGYGGSVNESTYSVQANDYQSHGLGVDYFKSLLDIYLNDERNQFGQITIGLENDSDWQKIDSGYEEQLREIHGKTQDDGLRIKTMAEFSDWYRSNFSKLSPEHRISNWFMSPFYRVGLSEKDGERVIQDLRIYNEDWPEANLLAANPWETLSLNNPYKIDTVRFSGDLKELPDNFSLNTLVKNYGKQDIPFKIKTFSLLLCCFVALLLLAIFLRKNLSLLLLVFFGSASLSLTMVKSGLVYGFGMGFWGPNGHDGIWHIALINQLSKFSFGNPVFSGMKLANYHFGFDLLAACLSRLTGLSPVNLYFQLLPPVMAILIGVLTFKFVEKWTLSKNSAWWAVFFVYFGGSWGWLVSLIRVGRLGGESTFWANQAISTLINPPYALSLIILLLGLILLLDYLKKPDKKNLVACAVLFGLLVQIKVYAGIIVLGSLCLLSLTTLLYRNVVRSVWLLTLSCIGVSLLIFLPFNFKASSLLVFSPLWFPRTMLAYTDRLGWFKLENARIAYLYSGKWLKWILAEGLALGIFILGNLGTRAIGFFYGGFLGRMKRKISEIEIFLFSALLISLILPLLVIQKGNPWNTIQFFYFLQFLMAMFSGIVVGNCVESYRKSSNYHILIYDSAILLTVGLTLMTTLTTLKNDYLPERPPARVSIEELEALEFLSKQADGIVLASPHDFSWHGKFSEPKPLYAYETTAYISALGNKQVYLEDEMNLEISGYNWRPRREEETRFFVTNDSLWANKFLKENKIRYIYLVKGQKMNLGLGDVNGEKIFENGEVVIYQVL